MEIGIQVSSLKPLLLTAAQVQDAFVKMKALGSHTVQIQWIDPSVPIPEIARILEETGVRSVSVQDFYDTVMADLSYYVDLNTATGGTWLCVSRIPDRLKSPQGLDAYIQELRDLQQKLDPLGQRVCLHPVTPDYTAVAGINAVEYLLENMPELEVCLDLFHLNRNCSDMSGFIRKFGSRICMVHFKDSIGDTLVPAGQGDIDWTGVVKACEESGVPYGFVEQERWNRDPYACLGEAMQWAKHEQSLI